jgi:hypothetical protein
MNLGDLDPTKFTDYIFGKIKLLGGQIGYGGFFEERRWYQQSAHFDQKNEPRDIHLGLDLCPLEGKIHSFQNNKNYLDYGPTIILEHDLNGHKFYSLYGHLSTESLDNKQVGQVIHTGEEFASIGDSSINGGWPAHLHLQLMTDMMGMKGDFPGVCAKSDVQKFKRICIDPQILLGLSA